LPLYLVDRHAEQQRQGSRSRQNRLKRRCGTRRRAGGRARHDSVNVDAAAHRDRVRVATVQSVRSGAARERSNRAASAGGRASGRRAGGRDANCVNNGDEIDDEVGAPERVLVAHIERDSHRLIQSGGRARGRIVERD